VDFRSERGAAMVTAFMVIVVLLLLGSALWQYHMTDALQVTRDQNRMKAHYLAKAGTEVGLGTVMAHRTMLDDIEDFNAEHEVTQSAPMGDGTFSLLYESVEDADTKVVSTGRVNAVTETITLKLTVSDGVLTRSDIDWYSGGNPHILHHNQTTSEPWPGKTIILQSDHDSQILRAPSNQDIDMVARALFFQLRETQTTSFEVANGEETRIVARLSHFEGQLRYEKKAGNELRFHVPGFEKDSDGDPVLVDDDKLQLNLDSGFRWGGSQLAIHNDGVREFVDLVGDYKDFFEETEDLDNLDAAAIDTHAFYGVTYFEDGLIHDGDVAVAGKNGGSGYYFYRQGATVTPDNKDELSDKFIEVHEDDVDNVIEALKIATTGVEKEYGRR